MLRAKTTQRLENKAGARFSGLANLPLKSKISMVVLAIVVLAAVFAPLIAPHVWHRFRGPRYSIARYLWCAVISADWFVCYGLGAVGSSRAGIDCSYLKQNGF